MKTLKYFFPLLLLLLSAASGTAEDTVPLPFSNLPDFTIPKGKIMYQRYCLFCHGEKGEGDGQNAFSLPVRPADLQKIVPERNDEQLFAIIHRGGIKKNLSPAMPSFDKTLSDQQIKGLIMYLRSFTAKNENSHNY